jgi:sterol desaturase/sphingolipid hydroxylase (fatty acid hydroxylase superfamily)
VRISQLNYYGDFVLYPIVIAGFAWLGLVRGTELSRPGWLLAVLCGATGWTLLEYGLHRIVFHKLGPVVAMHALHHAVPRALIGAPTWLTAGVFLVTLYAPLALFAPRGLASGITAGVVAGYLVYVTLHHVVHRPQSRFVRRILADTKRRHMLHHYAGSVGNFGVTTSAWDRVFRTRLRSSRR